MSIPTIHFQVRAVSFREGSCDVCFTVVSPIKLRWLWPWALDQIFRSPYTGIIRLKILMSILIFTTEINVNRKLVVSIGRCQSKRYGVTYVRSGDSIGPDHPGHPPEIKPVRSSTAPCGIFCVEPHKPPKTFKDSDNPNNGKGSWQCQSCGWLVNLHESSWEPSNWSLTSWYEGRVYP